MKIENHIKASKTILQSILPGKVLANWMKRRRLWPGKVGYEIEVPVGHIDQILQDRRAITFDIAFRLERYFGSSAREEWLSELNNLRTLVLYEAAVKMTLADLKYALKGLKRGDSRRPALKKLFADLKIGRKGLKGCITMSQIVLRALLRPRA